MIDLKPRSRRGGLAPSWFVAVLGLVIWWMGGGSPFAALADPAADTQADSAATNLQPTTQPSSSPATQPSGRQELIQKEARKLPPPPTSLDLVGLLKDPDVVAQNTDDTIWKIAPTAGYQLFQLPIHIEPGDQPFEFDQNVLEIRGGRFIAWRLKEEKEKAPDREFASGRPHKSVAAEEIEKNLPDDVPRVTRKFTVTPEGTIKWKLERAIPGCDVLDSERLYALRLKPELLEKKNPKPPGRARGAVGGNAEQRRQEAETRRTEEETYRAASAAYRDLSKQVRTLPSEFEDQLPDRVWAVFEVRAGTKDISIDGPTPLPWTITRAQFDSLRAFVATPPQPTASPNDAKMLPQEAYGRILSMSDLVANKHPYSARVVSFALAVTGMVKNATLDDPLFRLLQLILRGEDVMARKVVVKELISVVPPTAASTALLRMAGRDLDATAQLQWLKGRLNISSTDPRQVQDTVTMLNAQLADPKGPPPRDILHELSQTAAAASVAAGQPGGDASAQLVNGIRFEDIPDARLDEAIGAVIELAGSQPLARGWLDQRLLGGDQTLSRRTLELMRSAQNASPLFKPVVGSAMDLVFGAPKAGAAQDGGKDKKPTVRLGAPIPIDSVNHGLFRVLQSGDAQISRLAWDALPLFTFDTSVPVQPGPAGKGDERYKELIDAALAQRPTPRAIVPFITHQSDQGEVTAGLVRLVMLGDSDSSALAAKALLGSKRAINQTLAELSFGDRHNFASRVYQGLTDRAPLATALMRQPVQNSTVSEWFGKQLAEGTLPKASEWAEAFGSEDQLLDLVTSSDQTLAQGAVAALTSAAGGSDKYAQTVLAKMRNDADTSTPHLKQLWAESRGVIYAARLKKAAGAYRLELRVYGLAPAAAQTARVPSPTMPMPFPTSPGTPVQAGSKPNQVIQLSDALQLKADGQTVSFANQTVALSVPTSVFALRVDKPGDLKNFPNPEVGKLPLDQVPGPLDLLPMSGGVWMGQFRFADGRTGELVLTPVNGG